MAIVQISRIQHRKGLQQDLPQLASAELGWSIDTRQLYIGNGTISEGAPVEGVTEVLTQYSDILNIGSQYTFKGAQSGYISQTGVSALSPIQRTLQQKLDDYVNVRDFGALGDGIADDTAAIQRAIDEIIFGGFALTAPRLRRVIHFPPGTYILSDSIKLPAYVYLVGAGRDRTTIQQNSSTAVVIQLKDSSAQIGGAYGTLGASTAKFISVMDMTLSSTNSKNIVSLDSCNDIDFIRTVFQGSQSAPSGTSSVGQNAIYAVPTTASYGAPRGIRIIDCEIKNCTQGVIVNGNNIRIINTDFSTVSRGVWVDSTLTAAETRNIKVSGCTFSTVTREGIYINTTGNTPTYVMSMNNYYDAVGGTGSSVTTPVIRFAGTDNHSVGDSFTRTDAEAGVQPRVYHPASSINTSLDANVGLVQGMRVQGPGRVLSIAAGQTDANTGIVFTTTNTFATVKYSYINSGSSARRFGTLEIMRSGADVTYSDEYHEYPAATNFVYPGPTGLTLKVMTNSGGTEANIVYTTDVSSYGSLTYSITNLN